MNYKTKDCHWRPGLKCATCGYMNHKTEDCHHNPGKPKCYSCGGNNHFLKDCPNQNGSMKRKGDDIGEGRNKRGKWNEKSNVAKIMGPQDDEPEERTFCTSHNEPDEDLYDSYDDPDVTTYNSKHGQHFIWYDWYADSATTSHITNQRDAFKTYQFFGNQKREIQSIGNMTTKAEGWGMIELTSKIEGKTYIYYHTRRHPLCSHYTK